MAETLRWPSSLKKQVERIQKTGANKHAVPLKFLIVVLLVGVALFFIGYQYSKNTALGLFLSLSWISIMAIIICGRKIFSINFESDKLLRGLTGELIVAYELERLPEGWFIINDIVINGSQIDHIAVGPSGIYCIETKNWNNAACDENGTWYRFHLGNWVPIDTSPAKQNLNHVFSLKKFLKERMGLNINVASVVVLANPKGKFNIKSKVVPPGNTVICMPDGLRQILLDCDSTVLSTDEAHKLAHTLAGR